MLSPIVTNRFQGALASASLTSWLLIRESDTKLLRSLSFVQGLATVASGFYTNRYLNAELDSLAVTARTYSQHCGLARALDVVGERWTLLVVRELIAGPKRYKHLLRGLPGIGTGMLASRLKALEAAGIVRRTTLPPPADAQVYELT